MPRLSPKPLKLEDDEQKELEKILARHSTSQQIAKRGQIVLLAAQGKNHRQIATELGVSREMTRLWRERWLELKQEGVEIVERLKDAERPGAPTKFTTEQVLNLFAIACEEPEKYGKPISHWTSRELAEVMREQGIVESISKRHVGRLLSEATLKPQQSEYWLNPPPTKSLTTRSKISVMYTEKPKSLEFKEKESLV
jgi:putative transposase